MSVMTRSRRMQPVQNVAHNREQSAVQKLGQSQQYLAAQQAKLDELRSYRDQYTKDFEASGGGGLGATRLRDYRVFLNRLNQAISQQEALLTQCSCQHEETRLQWLQTRTHSQAIDKVVQRFDAEERRLQERREQKEQDEHAARSHKK